MAPIEFRAPWSRTLRTTTAISSALLLSMSVAGLLIQSHAPIYVSLALTILPLAILLSALPFMVRGYVLSQNLLLVKRLGWATRLPLEDLKSVGGKADAMHGSWRLFGNSGLFSFTGRFWNRQLGRYRAFATDPQRAVILRYATRTVVITPHDPQQFIMRTRTLLKTAGYPDH
jgi:hypothetical protein